MKRRHIIIIAIVVALSLIFITKLTKDAAFETNQTQIPFTITWQENPKNIAKRLKEKGLIKSKWLFYWYLKKNNLGSDVKAGTFNIPTGLSNAEISKIITGKNQAETSITIPEGSTIKQIDQLLTEKKLIGQGEFIACSETCSFNYNHSYPFPFPSKNIEGYVFPDTYFINPKTFKSIDLIERMLKNFEKKVDPSLAKETKRSLKDIITIASLLEKEIKTEKDLPVVAGILWKRLDNNWTLGVDASILYETGGNTLDAETLNIDSPYNTRKFPGLPPTPICNPGLKTIMASINPKESPYWFYLTTSQDQVIYAKTNEEHNENKAKFLRNL